MARVSIIIPIYNAEKHLRDTLESVIGQSCHDWACILVDDGSTDGSQRIIDSYCGRDERFVSFNKDNEGSPDLARKYGWERAETQWVMHLDADDVIEPSYLEKMLSRQNQTESDVVCSRIMYHRSGLEGELYSIPDQSFDMSLVLTGHDAFAKTIGGWEITCAGMLFRLNLTKKIIHGEYINSDEFTFRQILFHAQKVAFEDARYYCRENEDSVSRLPSVRMYQNLKVKQLLEDFVFKNCPNDVVLCSIAIKYRFQELVMYAAKFWLNSGSFTKVEQHEAKVWLRGAYDVQNMKRLSAFYPKYYRVFCHGFYWFGLMSVIYELRRRMK